MCRPAQKRFEFTIVETRTYTIVGEGSSTFEAEQDAIETFRNMSGVARAGKLSKVSKPRAVKARELKK